MKRNLTSFVADGTPDMYKRSTHAIEAVKVHDALLFSLSQEVPSGAEPRRSVNATAPSSLSTDYLSLKSPRKRALQGVYVYARSQPFEMVDFTGPSLPLPPGRHSTTMPYSSSPCCTEVQIAAAGPATAAGTGAAAAAASSPLALAS